MIIMERRLINNYEDDLIIIIIVIVDYGMLFVCSSLEVTFSCRDMNSSSGRIHSLRIDRKSSSENE